MKLNIIYAIVLSAAMVFVSCDKENPDIEPEKYSITLTIDGNGKLSAKEAAAVIDINIYYKKISSLSGVAYFTGLLYLDCSENNLVILDLTKNTKLVRLGCEDNDLTRLDVTKCPELIVLECYTNALTALDVTNNTKLNYLDCEKNRLKTLDASKMSLDSSDRYILFCGNQTTDGWAEQMLALTLRENMKSHWETSLKAIPYNKNVQLKQ